jgi:uncharacterized protein
MKYFSWIALPSLFLCAMQVFAIAAANPLIDAGKAAIKAKNYETAMVKFDEACQKGDADGCSAKGVLYDKGWGVTQDNARAHAIFVTACAAGSAKGCFNLGGSYYLGRGVEKDVPLAFAAYTKSCDGGDMGGCDNLGIMYEYGEGTRQDIVKAQALYIKACIGDAAITCKNISENLVASVAATTAPGSFEIDAATLAAQVPPSKAGPLLPHCEYEPKVKLCAAAHSITKMIDAESGPKQLDTVRLAQLNEGVRKYPGGTNWQFFRAKLFIESHRFGEALADLSQVLKVAPSSTAALLQRAELYTHAKQYDLAFADLDAAYYWSDLEAPNSGSTPRIESLILNADVLLRQGKMADTKAMLERANFTLKRDADGPQYRMLQTVTDRYTSARTGLSVAEMAELRVFFEMKYQHTPKCDKSPLLDRAIAADFMAVAALGYLAGLSDSCQSNADSMSYANRAVTLGLEKEKLPSTALIRAGPLDLIDALRARSQIYERLGDFTEALRDINTAHNRYDRGDQTQAALARISSIRIRELANNLPPEKVAALGITVPPTSGTSSATAFNSYDYSGIDSDLQACQSVEKDRDKIPAPLLSEWFGITTRCSEIRREAISIAEQNGDKDRAVYYRSIQFGW